MKVAEIVFLNTAYNVIESNSTNFSVIISLLATVSSLQPTNSYPSLVGVKVSGNKAVEPNLTDSLYPTPGSIIYTTSTSLYAFNDSSSLISTKSL